MWLEIRSSWEEFHERGEHLSHVTNLLDGSVSCGFLLMPYFIAEAEKADPRQGNVWLGDNRDARMPSGKYYEIC